MASDQTENGEKLFRSNQSIPLPDPTVWNSNCGKIGEIEPRSIHEAIKFYTALNSFNAHIKPESDFYLETSGHKIMGDKESYLYELLEEMVTIGTALCKLK